MSIQSLDTVRGLAPTQGGKPLAHYLRWSAPCAVSYVKAQHGDALDRVIKKATIVDPSACGALRPLHDVPAIGQPGLDGDRPGAGARRNDRADARLSAVLDLDPLRHARSDRPPGMSIDLTASGANVAYWTPCSIA
jgi:hypothetical protein